MSPDTSAHLKLILVKFETSNLMFQLLSKRWRSVSVTAESQGEGRFLAPDTFWFQFVVRVILSNHVWAGFGGDGLWRAKETKHVGRLNNVEMLKLWWSLSKHMEFSAAAFKGSTDFHSESERLNFNVHATARFKQTHSWSQTDWTEVESVQSTYKQIARSQSQDTEKKTCCWSIMSPENKLKTSALFGFLSVSIQSI